MSERESGISKMNRREVLIGAAALASAAAVSGSASAASHEHAEGHDHAAHAARHPGLLAALEACIGTGRVCAAHCLVSFREGDTALAECAIAVSEMIAVCDATASLAAANSSHLPALSKVCLTVCEACSDACREHAKMHTECRECMEACDAVVVELEKVAA